MRATRAYIAGFGTAGSLLAGAAMVFVLASAVVAFRGWPQVGSASAPASVVVAHANLSGASRAERTLVVAAASTGTRGASPAASSARTSAGPTAGSTGHSVRVAVSQKSSHRVATPPSSVTPTTPTTPTPPGCGSHCAPPSVGSTVSTVIQGATGAVGNTVAAAGKSLGSTVSGLTSAVANKLAGVSPGLSSVVSKAGSAVGGLLNGAGSTVGNALGGVTNTLSGLLHH